MIHSPLVCISILQLPKVQFFHTGTCNVPEYQYRSKQYFQHLLKNIPVLPDKVTYENLEITFIVDEKLENYRELHN